MARHLVLGELEDTKYARDDTDDIDDDGCGHTGCWKISTVD